MSRPPSYSYYQPAPPGPPPPSGGLYPSNGYNYGYPLGPPGPPPPGPGYGYPSPPPPNPYSTHNTYPYPPPPQNNGHGHSPGPGYRPHSHNPNPQPMMMMNPSNGPQTLLLRQSPQTHKIIFIHPAGQPTTAPPLYSLTSSPKSSKADYVLARGSDPNNAQALVGEVKSHTFSSKYDLIVRGTQCLLKESTLGDKYTITIPGLGTYKWGTDPNGMSSKMWLRDENKNVLATYNKSREPSSVSTWKKFVGGKDRELVIQRPVGGEFFVEVLLVSIYAVKMAQEGAIETASEVVGAVAGA
ncbi:hypothetical protein BJY01DRAFT_238941 [Aspergillus pseudoustus]|uniref:Tubby C-terminal-like domain-containing protein n=1 Tax=Aspergillus pseudoustus TaxID=1810923 RepID=A0ABR4J5J0_9EURO